MIMCVCVCVCGGGLSHFSHAWFFATLWTTLWTETCQALLSMGFFRQESWSRLSCPPPGDLPDLRIKPPSPMSLALTGSYFTTRVTYAMLCKALQSCPTLCDPIDGSPSGSPIPGILQARTLEWIAISFSNAWEWKWSHSVMSDS